MLTTKRKAASITPTNGELNPKQKKLKTEDTNISNGESNIKQKKLETNISNGDNQQPINDCREIPFKGINNKA